MPAGPIGSVWATGTWADTVWEAGVWGTAEALSFVFDLNTRIAVYLRELYGLPGADLTALIARYLAAQPDADVTALFQQLIAEATAEMT